MNRRRWVLHVDLDQFIAAVELLRRPELRGRPVVVGGSGDPTQRGVVATASYEARAYGVGSGMPLRTAAKRCPHAVFLPSDPAAYDEASARVMETLRGFPAVVEVLGWDEAFMEIVTEEPPGDETSHEEAGENGGAVPEPAGESPEEVARAIQRAVRSATELSCAVGIGDNKLRAKLATGFGKPGGIFRLTEENWYSVMAGRPTDALWGIGAKTARKLADLGIATVADLALSDPRFLAERFGPKVGPWLRMLSRGVDNSPVVGTPYVPRSHGRETTFQTDLTDWSDVRVRLSRLARRVAADVVAERRPVARVGVKVRFAPFRTTSASVPFVPPGAGARVVEDEGAAVTGARTAEDEAAATSRDATTEEPAKGNAKEDAAMHEKDAALRVATPAPLADEAFASAFEAAAHAALAKVEERERSAGRGHRPVRLLGVRADFGPP